MPTGDIAAIRGAKDAMVQTFIQLVGLLTSGADEQVEGAIGDIRGAHEHAMRHLAALARARVRPPPAVSLWAQLTRNHRRLTSFSRASLATRRQSFERLCS